MYTEIPDLELDAGTDETLGLPFWGGEHIFICFLLLYLGFETVIGRHMFLLLLFLSLAVTCLS